jgi:hypothetical protein
MLCISTKCARHIENDADSLRFCDRKLGQTPEWLWGAGMLRRLIAAVCGLAAAVSLGTLGGCAESRTAYPSIGTISDVTRTLSPQEREKTLNDLTAEKQRQDEAAK